MYSQGNGQYYQGQMNQNEMNARSANNPAALNMNFNSHQPPQQQQQQYHQPEYSNNQQQQQYHQPEYAQNNSLQFDMQSGLHPGQLASAYHPNSASDSSVSYQQYVPGLSGWNDPPKIARHAKDTVADPKLYAIKQLTHYVDAMKAKLEAATNTTS